ncbi:MAG: ATPase domain-containing protein [Methanosarcinales archaeon]
MKYCSSGIKYLDEILGGGLSKASIILIAGTAGTGKTTLVLQSLSKAAESGEKVVYMPITSMSAEKMMDYFYNYSFFNDDIMIHPIDRSTIEKDPLTTLLDIGNILASTDPDRIAINPLTTMGYGFSPTERRRFFYSFDAMLQDFSAQTLVTGELSRTEIHDSILSHISDGVIFLDRQITGHRMIREMEIMKMRGMSTSQNGNSSVYEFKVEQSGISLFPKLELKTTMELMDGDRLSTGVDGLDKMIRGGIPKQSTVLVVGGAGTGKTVMGLHFIIAGLMLGEPGVIVLLEEHENQLIREVSRFGWDLKSFIDQGLLRIIYSNLNNISPDEHNLMIKSCIEEIGAKRLFFDNIYKLESAISDTLELKNHINLLTDFLKYNGITVMLTYEVSGSFNPGQMPEVSISSIVDAIILLHFIDEKSRFDHGISIPKLMSSDHDMSIRKYIIGNNGIEII